MSWKVTSSYNCYPAYALHSRVVIFQLCLSQWEVHKVQGILLEIWEQRKLLEVLKNVNKINQRFEWDYLPVDLKIYPMQKAHNL